MKADNQPEEPEQLVVADAPTLDTELHPGWNWAKPEHIPEPTYWPVALAGWIGDLIRDQRAH